MALPSNPQIGQKYYFGTPYANGTKQLIATRPWRPDTSHTQGDGTYGNIPQYSSGAIEIRDTDATATYQIPWVYCGKRNGKDFYIADRNLLVSVSWDTLNNNSLIFGKTQTVDGKAVKICSLTGGANDTGTSGDNDWNNYICNRLSLSGLVTPNATDLDNSTMGVDITSASNIMWNWLDCYSWCQETYTGNSSSRSLRGYSGAAYWTYNTSSYTATGIGFRPALEILNSAPLFSDFLSDTDLGEKTAGFALNLNVSDNEGDEFSLSVTLDGETILDLEDQTEGEFEIDITGDTYAELSIGTHTIVLTATDSQGAENVRTLTFDKINTPPTAPAINGLANGQRIKTSGSVSFTTSTDADGDDVTYYLQFAPDATFTTGMIPFSGDTSPISFSGLTVNTTMYARVVADDGNATTASGAIQVKIGDTLEFYSKPAPESTMPLFTDIYLDMTVDPAATVTVEVCNNANDDEPVWEDATADYRANRAHTFTNDAKTDDSWAIQMHFTAVANAATGDIEARSFGLGTTLQ